MYGDFDAALALAQTYDLYFDFVLFNAPTAIPSSWITDPSQRSQLVLALGQLFAHYKGNSHVLSWEVFNEPEYDIWNGKIAQAPVQATVQSIASAVHANSNAYVTVGSAMLDGLPMWIGLGLDYYEAHWYDYMSSGDFCARCTDYPTVQAKYGLDQPLVIGELYASSSVDARQRFIDFYNKGYAGAWPWSMFPSHTSDGLSIDFAAMNSFTSQHSDVGPRKGIVATPTPTRTPTSTPTATPTASTGTETIGFDDLSNPDRPLDGQYPSGVINWGSGAWWLSSPWGKFQTQSISFNGPDLTSATLTFLMPRRLLRLDAYNGDNNSSTLTLSCGSQPTRQVTLAADQLATIQTNWTGACSSVTLATTNGWNTNFDNLVIQ